MCTSDHGRTYIRSAACDANPWLATTLTDEGSNNHRRVSRTAQTVFDRSPGRGPLAKTLCAKVAPCQLATHVIDPLQYVGVALSPRGQSKRMQYQYRNESLSTSSKEGPFLQIAWSNDGATKASVGSRLEFDGSARSIGCGRKTAGRYWEFETSTVDATTFEAIGNHWGVVV
jgi:hypothetical protein